jgi:hypothetical protein
MPAFPQVGQVVSSTLYWRAENLIVAVAPTFAVPRRTPAIEAGDYLIFHPELKVNDRTVSGAVNEIARVIELPARSRADTWSTYVAPRTMGSASATVFVFGRDFTTAAEPTRVMLTSVVAIPAPPGLSVARQRRTSVVPVIGERRAVADSVGATVSTNVIL